MAIRRKDGSIYKISGPNKIMLTQDLWDSEYIIRHNFDNYSSEVLVLTEVAPKADKPKLTPESTALEASDFLKEFEESKDQSGQIPVEPKAEIKSEPIPEPEPELKLDLPTPEIKTEQPIQSPEILPQDNRPRSKFRSFERSMLYCLPAKVSQLKDSLYGDDIMRVTYDAPFKFQAAYIRYEQAGCSVWTTIQMATRLSIIFDGTKKRWWKVTEIQVDPSGDGVVIHAVPSQITPDFSSYLASGEKP